MDQQPTPSINSEQPAAQPNKPMGKTWQIATIVVAGILVLGGVSYGAYYYWQNFSSGQKACTMEAKLCSDGSSVGRTGPNCEFAECPSASTTSDPTAGWQTYKNDKYGFEVKYPSNWGIDPIVSSPINFFLRNKVFLEKRAKLMESDPEAEVSFRGPVSTILISTGIEYSFLENCLISSI